MEHIPQLYYLLGATTMLTLAGVYLYSTAKRGRGDIVRQDNADLRASNQELRTERAGYIATITQQTDTIKNLREVATQTPAVTQLLDLTSKQQQTTNKQHSDVIQQLSELAKQMSKMTTEVSAAMRMYAESQQSNGTRKQP